MQQNSLLVNKAQQFCKEHHVHLLYLTLFGSKLYGTDMPGTSDLDVRGIFLPSLEKAVLDEIPHSLHWSSGNSASRNSADDLDMDLWSVQHWLLKLLPAGDMGATDLLFSPSNSNCTLYRDCRLDTVFAFPTKLYDTKGCRAYADYSLKQAKKYGIRGTRLGALRSVYIWITSSFPEISPDLRIKDVLHDLIGICGDSRYCVAILHEGKPALQLCGKIHAGTVRLREFSQRVITDMNRYGAKAIAAEHDKGVDFKALSHALRAFDQMEELYNTGRIVFPLTTREKLKSVKRGDIPWLELEQIIVRRLAEIDTKRAEAKCICRYDREFARQQILKCYGIG